MHHYLLFFMLLTWLLPNNLLTGQEYRVQLAAYCSKAPFTEFAFSGITDVYKNIDQNTLHRYYFGRSFRTTRQAEMVRNELLKRGFPNAQIIDIEREKSLCGNECPFSNMGTIYSNMRTENLFLRTIFFDFDRSSLHRTSRKKLDELYEILEYNPNLNAFIVGHTDAMGSPKYNAALSKRRARKARSYLISKGISAKRISAKACGESTPVAINRGVNGRDSPEGRHYNRRVVIAIVNQKGEVINDLVRKTDVPGHLQVSKQILHQQLMHVQIEK